MDQRQTNTLLFFLTTMIVLFVGYPVLFGGFLQSGDLFSFLVIIIFSVLIAWIYHLIQEPEKYILNINMHSRLGYRLLFVIFAALLLLLIPIICFWKIDHAGLIVKEFLIGIAGGLVSGIIVALIGWAYSN